MYNRTMRISDALEAAAKRQNVSDVQIAAAVSVTEKTVSRWRTGKNEPRGSQLMALRKAFPIFADLLDGKAA